MRVVDTFLFSEKMEADMLLVKFHNEANTVHKFILIENS